VAEYLNTILKKMDEQFVAAKKSMEVGRKS